MTATSINSQRTLARNPIPPYALPGEECIAYNKIHWQLNRDRVILLVHDMQNYWVDLFVDASPLLRNVETLVGAFRDARLPVVFCRGERARSRFERGLGLTVWGDGLNAAHVSDHDCQIVATLAPRADEYIVHKPRHSAFFDTELEPTLRKMHRDQVVICGVFAHHGVMVSCMDGYMRNYQMTMVADALGDYSEAEQRMALQWVAQMCGSVSTTQRVVNALR
ncbi:MAG: isochorismatase family protein [Burkholderiales bacterium]|nr:isochorismatase family protein [Burkholderiales bacterium]